MIRRQTLKIPLIFCTWVKTPPLIRLNKVSRERESANWRRRRILRASPVCSRFHLFLLFHAEKSNNASRVQPRSQVFILNKFWTNKNNRLCLQQRLGWMAGDNTIGSFEEHKLDIFVYKILCLYLLRKKCCKLYRKIRFDVFTQLWLPEHIEKQRFAAVAMADVPFRVQRRTRLHTGYRKCQVSALI